MGHYGLIGKAYNWVKNLLSREKLTDEEKALKEAEKAAKETEKEAKKVAKNK